MDSDGRIDGIDMVDVAPISTVTGVMIELMSSEMVRRQASVNILNGSGVDSKTGTCIDPHMGGDSSTVCLTCGQGNACVGHPGCIPLVWPIYHQAMFGYLIQLLPILCYHCGGLYMDRNSRRLQDLGENYPPPTGPDDWKGSLYRIRAISAQCSKSAKLRLCHKCGYPQPTYSFVRKGNLQVNATWSAKAWAMFDPEDPVEKQLLRRMQTSFIPIHAREILIAAERYNGDDLQWIGVLHKGIDALVPDRLSVLPNNMRSVQSGTVTAHSKARAAHNRTWSIGQVPYQNAELIRAANSFFATGETLTMKRAMTAAKRREKNKAKKAAAERAARARAKKSVAAVEEEEEGDGDGEGEEEDTRMGLGGEEEDMDMESTVAPTGLRVSPGGVVTGPEKIVANADPEDPMHWSLVITKEEREAMGRRRAEETQLLDIPQFPEVPIATREEFHACVKADAFLQILFARGLMQSYAAWVDMHNSTWKKRSGGGEDTSLRHVLDKKEGALRRLEHRRMGYGGRAMIGQETGLNLQEMGIPQEQALVWTLPERVTDFNKELLTECVRRGPGVMGGATHIIRADGLTQPVPDTQEARDEIQLQVGWVVRRHMQNGDDVIIYRAPVLHTRSFFATRARIVKGSMIRVSDAQLQAANGDFDGDEMNPHLAQEMRERAEYRYLASISANCVSASTNNPQQGLTQNWLSFGWLMCRSWVDRAEMMELCMASAMTEGWDNYAALPKTRITMSRVPEGGGAAHIPMPPPAVMVPNKARRRPDGSIDASLPPFSTALWTGKQGFSTAMRHAPINYTSDAGTRRPLPYTLPCEEEQALLKKKSGRGRWTKKMEARLAQLLSARRSRNVEHALARLHDYDVARRIVIRGGELLAGSVIKQFFAWRGTRTVQHAYIAEKGGEVAIQTLTRMRDVLRVYGLRHVRSFKDSDFTPSHEAMLQMEKLRAITRGAGLELRNAARDGGMDPALLYAAYEKLCALHQKSIAGILMHDLRSRHEVAGPGMNFLITMIDSGAKGSTGTVMDMSGDLGLQRKQGKPVGLAVKSKRLSSCFGVHKYLTLEGIGMVMSSMLTGLDPAAGIPAHNIAARTRVVTRCNEIADSGALSRRIKHAVGDVVTNQIRAAVEGDLVVQQLYGGDGMDPQKLVVVDTGIWLWGDWGAAFPPTVPEAIEEELRELRRRVQQAMLVCYGGEVIAAHRLPWVEAWVWENRVWGRPELQLDVASRSAARVDASDMSEEELEDAASTSVHAITHEVARLQNEIALWIPHHIAELYALYHAWSMLRMWEVGVKAGVPHLYTPRVWAAYTEEVVAFIIKALVPSAEPVGVLATQSMGEPMTQMMLNSVHGDNSVGDPLQEINCLYQRSEPAFSYMDVALKKGADPKRTALSFVSTRLAILADNVSVIHDPLPEPGSGEECSAVPEDATLLEFAALLGETEAEMWENQKAREADIIYQPAPYIIRMELNHKTLTERRITAAHVARYVARHIQKQRKQMVTTIHSPAHWPHPVVRVRPWAQVHKETGEVVLEKQFKYKNVEQDVSMSLVGVGASVAANVYGSTGRVAAGTGTSATDAEKQEGSDEAKGEDEDEETDTGKGSKKRVPLPQQPFVPEDTAFDKKLMGLGSKTDELMIQQELHDLQKNPLRTAWGEMVRENLAKSLALGGVSGIREAYPTSVDVVCRDQTTQEVVEARLPVIRCDCSILLGTTRIPGVDPMASWTNDLVDMSRTIGVTAARHQAAHLLYNKLCSTGVTIDPRHVHVLIDRQTAQGIWARVNTAGFSQAGMGAMKQLGYERQLQVLSQLAFAGTMDERRGPTGALLGAQRPEIGTGSVTLLTDNTGRDTLPKSSTKYSHVVHASTERESAIRRERMRAYHKKWRETAPKKEGDLGPGIQPIDAPQALDINKTFSTDAWLGQRSKVLRNIERGLDEGGRSVWGNRHAKPPPSLSHHTMVPPPLHDGDADMLGVRTVHTHTHIPVQVTAEAELEGMQPAAKKQKTVRFSERTEVFRDSRFFLRPPPIESETLIVGSKRGR